MAAALAKVPKARIMSSREKEWGSISGRAMGQGRGDLLAHSAEHPPPTRPDDKQQVLAARPVGLSSFYHHNSPER